MNSKDKTVLIDILWLNVVHYSSLFQYFFRSTVVPTLLLIFSALVCYFFGNTVMTIMIEKNVVVDPGQFKGFHGTSLFASNIPLKSCYKAYIKSVYFYTTRLYNKTLTFTSFYYKIIGTYVILHWYALSASKIIISVYVLETNTGDFGGFIQVQHYWGVNICCEFRYMKSTGDSLKPSRAYHKINTFHGERRWMGHKGGPSKSMKNVLYVLWCAKRHI